MMCKWCVQCIIIKKLKLKKFNCIGNRKRVDRWGVKSVLVKVSRFMISQLFAYAPDFWFARDVIKL